jgi:glycerol-3-phosphate dehydrogenase
LIEHEWAASAEDVLWRRTKSGLPLDPGQREAVARYVAQRVS